VTEHRSVLQPELFERDLDGREEVTLQHSPDTDVLGTEKDEGHQAAGDARAPARTSHVSDPVTQTGAVLPLTQTQAMRLPEQALRLKWFKTGFGQSKRWPRQKLQLN